MAEYTVLDGLQKLVDSIEEKEGEELVAAMALTWRSPEGKVLATSFKVADKDVARVRMFVTEGLRQAARMVEEHGS